MDGYECQGFKFYSNFDSANLHRVVFVPKNDENDTPQTTITGKTDVVDYEFNLWTKHDCSDTEFENGNRTWFYFAVKTPLPLVYVKFNIVDMNKQAKLYGQGMVPVYRIVPSSKQNWDRILEKPTFTVEDVFTLSFKFRMPENTNAIIYFAFTYPYSFVELQTKLDAIDKKQRQSDKIDSLDDVYYVRETVCHTLQNRKVDLLTISSFHGITDKRETRLRNLFPDKSVERPYLFIDKKVIFLSARVHPGETPSSFVLNGFINLILTKDDTIAQALRRLYVFKIVPCLNPDGVVNGHYRTDTRGVNLNRVYLNPSPTEHPTIYAARSLIRYAHYGYERETDEMEVPLITDENIITEVGAITLDEKNKKNKSMCKKCRSEKDKGVERENVPQDGRANICVTCGDCVDVNNSGLFLYLDMHGHASKKGIFMYGNHFDDIESNVHCMLLPKVMSLNNQNFHFTACNFTEKNMYLKDKRDGMSREGSGRVAVYKLTGLIQSYTLECNYNTGRLVNQLPPCIKEGPKFMQNLIVPPKYNPAVFEEVGRSLGASILDLTNSNLHTRISHSEYHSLNGMRDWLRIHSTYNLGTARKTPKKAKIRQAASLHAQGKAVRPVLKTRSFPTKCHPKKSSLKPGLKQRQAKAAAAAAAVAAASKRERKCGSPQPSCSHDRQHLASSSSSSSGGCHSTRRKPALLMNQKQAASQTMAVGNKRAGGSTSPSVNFIARNIRNTSPVAKGNLQIDRKPGDVNVKEICYVKGGRGKQVIATYEQNNRVLPDNLIVAWDGSNAKPQMFTHKSRTPAFLNRRSNSDGETRHRNYRSHNFQKHTQGQVTGGTSTVNYIARNIRNTSPATKAAHQAERKQGDGNVKDASGKRIITTCEQTNRILPESLTAAWDETNSRSQMFSNKSRTPGYLSRKMLSEGEPRQRNFRVHNFQKQGSKAKLNKATKIKTKTKKKKKKIRTKE